MTALSIQPTFPTFTGADGQPLENGYIWVGTANLNPITNPITVYWDAALSAPATQPIRTLGGYPSNSGTPARLYVNSDYSIQVLDRKGSVVYSAPVATDRYGGGIINANIVVYDPSGTGAVATTVQGKLRESVSVKDFGADPTGVADSTAAMQAAIDSLAQGGTLYIPAGYFKFSSVSTTKAICIRGQGFTNNKQSVYGSAEWTDLANFGGSVLISTAASGDAISMGAQPVLHNFQLSDFMLVGPGSGTATGIHLNYGVGTYVENVFVGNFTTGWNIENSQDATYNKIVAKGNKTGLILQGSVITSNQTVFLNPEFQRYETYGMNIVEAAMVQIVGGLFQDRVSGVALNIGVNSSYATVKGVWFENSATDTAVNIVGTGTTVENCYFANRVSDNIKIRSTAYGTNLLHNNLASDTAPAPSIEIDTGAVGTYIFDSPPSSNGSLVDYGTGTIYITTENGKVTQTKGAFVPSYAPAVSAYATVTQSFTASTQTKVDFAGESFDTTSCFDTSNGKFLPLVAGYYQINVNLDVYVAAGIGTAIATVYKNGSAFKRIANYSGSAAEAIFNGQTLMYFNGSSDYVEVYIFVTGASPTIQASAGLYSYMDALLVKAV